MPRRAAPSGGLSPEKVLLGLLRQRSAHGYELQHRLSVELGQLWHLAPSQIYATLDRLEQRGLIAGRDLRAAGAPPRREYRLTEPGRREFESWLKAPTAVTVRAIRIEFTTRLYLAQTQSPELAQRLLAEQRTAVLECLHQHEALLAALPAAEPFNRLALLLRVQTLRGILDWLADCEKALT
jgi:DNA-binding PadR family transcriptional regulator